MPDPSDARTPGGKSEGDWTLSGGDALGGYRVIRPLGRGGMGEVYLVENVQMGKRYALKLLPADLAGDATFRERFRREARVMADLEHPGIVPVLYMGEEDGRYFLAMTYVEGPQGGPRTLEAVLKERGRLPEDEVRKLALELCDALAYAHGRGIVHRDIKPSNILLDGNERAKLSDFGLARIAGDAFLRSVGELSVSLSSARTEDAADRSERDRALIGTYEYMSPEQKSGRPAGERSDVYSVGLILYAMLTGTKAEGCLRKPSEFGCASGWDGIAQKALSQGPEDRYPSAADLAADIRLTASSWRERHAAAIPALACLLSLLVLTAVYAAHALATRRTPKDITLELRPGVKLEMIYVSPGEFLMGSAGGNNEERPVHKVTLARGFYIGKFEVTHGQYACVTAPDEPPPADGQFRPEAGVSWDEAAQFCEKLTERTGRPFRLPAEAEWEYACRAGGQGKYCFGDDAKLLAQYAWFSELLTFTPHPVGQKLPNAWNIHDMHGNLREWCSDYYDDGYYSHSPARDPEGPAVGTRRVIRGGSFRNAAGGCRSAHRIGQKPTDKSGSVGFRVVAELPSEP